MNASHQRRARAWKHCYRRGAGRPVAGETWFRTHALLHFQHHTVCYVMRHQEPLCEPIAPDAVPGLSEVDRRAVPGSPGWDW